MSEYREGARRMHIKLGGEFNDTEIWVIFMVIPYLASWVHIPLPLTMSKYFKI